MQAQEPRDPYLALWSRLDGFEPADLEAALLDRSARADGGDARHHPPPHAPTTRSGLRPLFQPVLDGEMARHSQHKAALAGVDLATGAARSPRKLLVEPHADPPACGRRSPSASPSTTPRRWRSRAGTRSPSCRRRRAGCGRAAGAVSLRGRRALARAARRHGHHRRPRAPLPAPPSGRPPSPTSPRGRGSPGSARSSNGCGRSSARGPTSAGASSSTSPTGEITDADVPAPVRFLPEYDNVLLSHADRSRVTGGLPPGLYPADALGIGHVLVDGRVQATWRRDEGERRDRPRRHRPRRPREATPVRGRGRGPPGAARSSPGRAGGDVVLLRRGAEPRAQRLAMTCSRTAGMMCSP